MLAHTVLYPDYTSIGAPLIADLTYFNQIRNRTNNIWKAPHESTWGTLYSYFEVANAAMEYQKLSNSTTYEPLVLDVLNYFYGQNPWGLSFIASEDLPKSITSTYAVMYRLQPQIFPRGEIAEGPTTADEHLANEEWFDPIHNPNLWHKEFNSPDFTFFEEPGDYVCMETTISGLADGLFLLATAIQMYNESEIIEIPNPIQILDLEASTKDHKILYTFSCPTSSTAKVIIYNSQGIAIHAENYTSGNQISDEVEVPHGFYIVELKIGASIESKKIIVR